MYLNIHIPKTGGTSFRMGVTPLINALYDYGPKSESTSAIIKATTYADKIDSLPDFVRRASIEMLAGHFPVSKYRSLFPEAKLITFFREPLSRIISEYNFLTKLGAINMKFEQFCEHKNQQNKQSRLISGTCLEDFYFFGVIEHFAESIARFNKLSGLNVPELSLKPANKLAEDLPAKVTKESISKDYLEFLKEVNQLDLQLYQEALAIFKKNRTK